MPAITVSAVDTALETLTGTAHGLTTGDRFRLRNVGGALPSATPALAPATDLFALRVDADTIKVYDTNAHALAGGATGLYDITGAGSGTTTIEYGLPYALPTAAAAAGTQIKSVNDNQAWAALVAIYSLLVGITQTVWSAITLAVDVTLATNKNITLQGTGTLKHGTRTLKIPIDTIGTNAPGSSDVTLTAAATVQKIIPLLVGHRILAIRAVIRDSATGPTKLQMAMFHGSAGGALSQDELGAASAGDGSLQTISRTLAAPLTITAGSVYALQVKNNTGTANCHLYDLEVDYDTP